MSTVASPPDQERNHTVDVARAVSVIIVVIFHGFLYKATLTPDGISIVNWNAPRFVWGLSWLLMAMPMFFVCGGFAHAVIVDKMRQRGTGYANFLANRGRRLTGGLLIFVTFFAALATIFAWVWDVDLAVRLSAQLMRLLWFLSVYLVIVLFAPVLVALHDRYGAWVMVVGVVGVVMVDREMLGHGNPAIGVVNMFLVWPLCHQFGIAYHRGWFRRGPIWQPFATIGLSIVAVGILILHFGYASSAVGFGNNIGNHIPPTLAMVALGIGQAALLGLVERWGAFTTLDEVASKRVAKFNALMMTVYLWHIPCLLIGGSVLIGLSLLLPGLAFVFLAQPVVVAVGFALISVVCPLIGLLEYRLVPQMGVRQDGRRAVAAFMLTILGSLLIYEFGTVLHFRAPWSTLGVVLVWIGEWFMVRATRPRGVERDHYDSLTGGRRSRGSRRRAGDAGAVAAQASAASAES